jgi:hypothetical protein
MPAAFESDNVTGLVSEKGTHDSIRVVYRDPREQEEKKKLMKLAGIIDSNASVPAKASRKKPVARPS